ncbi:hypothetical protein MTR_3g069810 [Medicago truncatula]|uniref:Uncharacterized protein n=1 Tax=Medicago truncatula TaxID=3880 RepID=G7JAL1_MEDTR|nr:hypothetical protein MTR_3g069810 [Medicago truncatula]
MEALLHPGQPKTEPSTISGTHNPKNPGHEFLSDSGVFESVVSPAFLGSPTSDIRAWLDSMEELDLSVVRLNGDSRLEEILGF